jgi:cyanophycin synthetase
MNQFPHERRLAVYSAAGYRRDVDLIRQGQLLGDAFDRVVIYEDHYLRGREPGEIIALFRQGLEKGKRVREIHEITGWKKSCEQALSMVQPGELLLVQADVVDETIDYLKSLVTTEVSIRQIDLSDALAPAKPIAPPPQPQPADVPTPAKEGVPLK